MGPMLEGKLSIITGAARGIGEAAALLFASEGARLVLTDRDEGPLQEVVSRIRSLGGEAIAVPGDVSAEHFPEALVRSAVERFGSDIRVIVNNAGYTWDGVFHKMTDDQWEAMLKVHCTAPFRILRAAAP